MKKYSSNENFLSLIQKDYELKNTINQMNHKNYKMNRNQTFNELNKLFDKEPNLNKKEETILYNSDINRKKEDYFRDNKYNKIIKKKYNQNILLNKQNIKNENIFFHEKFKSKFHNKKKKVKNHKGKITYSLECKNKKTGYSIEREFQEDKAPNNFGTNYYSKGLKKKTYEILSSVSPDKITIENQKDKNNKNCEKFSENIFIRNIQKTNKKIEYDRQFTDYDYEQKIMGDDKFDRFNPLLNNCQFNETQKLSIDPCKIKNIRCQIQLNNSYHPNKNLNELYKDKTNIYTYTYSNNEDLEDTNLYSNYNKNISKTNKNNINEYLDKIKYCNYTRKNNCPLSPIEYISTYSTGSDDNNKIKKCNNYFKHICQTETNILTKVQDKSRRTYQLEDPDCCICCNSICGFHFEPEIKKVQEIDKIANFKISGKYKNLNEFYTKLIPDNNKSFSIYQKQKSFNNFSVQNNLDEELINKYFRNKQLQIKISQEREICIKGKYKPKNKIIVQDFFKIKKVRKSLKDQGTNMNKNIRPSISFNERFSFIIDDNLIRKRNLLMQIILKKMLCEKNKLNDIFIEWYNKTIKIAEIERVMKKKRLKMKKIENFEISHKISKRDKCIGNEYTPNTIEYNLEIEVINNIEKNDKEVFTDNPYGFSNESLQRGKINSIIYESNRDYLNKVRINEILIKIINSRITPNDEVIIRKYFSIWYRKSQYIPLLENARIISEFCKSKLIYILSIKNWRKLYQKILLKDKKANIIKILHKLKVRKYRVYKLVKITRLMQIFNRKKFLKYLILCWFINTNSSLTKKNQMKILYENMLTTYISIADDIFGNNKKNNPSIQHSIMEAVDSNKYQTKQLKELYFFTNNNIKLRAEIEKEKKLSFYEKYINNYFSPVKISKYKEESKINIQKRGISYENKNEGKFKINRKNLKNQL